MREHRLELAAEYLLMAAFLIEVKSRMLLPKPRSDSPEAEDPRAELVKRLLEYERMKLAAQGLDALPQVGRDFSIVQVWIEESISADFAPVSVDDLRAAWLGLLSRARMSKHHQITRERLSVREFMSQILRRLQGARFVRFEDLFEVSAGTPILVVTFLALLELARESLVELTQQGIFSPIYVRLCNESS
jgi:segregation and condensation protein A